MHRKNGKNNDLIGAKKKTQQVSLSSDTICRRIVDMAAHVCQEVCSEIKQSTLQASIQLDESTDSALKDHLTAFARYEKDKKMKKEFLFSNILSATTTAADVKALVDSFFEANELSWQNFKLISTDSALAMIGVISGFVTLVKNKWPYVTSSHCSLFTAPIHSSIKDSASTFDGSYGCCGQSDQLRSFKGRNSAALPTFGQKKKEMGAQHVGLLFYTKVRWLSRGKCLSRLYELKTVVETFLRENKHNLHVQFHNERVLAYLADVFSHLNNINLSLQGRDVPFSDDNDKLSGLTARMGVWQARIEVESTASFPLLERGMKINGIDLTDNIMEHLKIVSAEFRSYFNDDTLHVL